MNSNEKRRIGSLKLEEIIERTIKNCESDIEPLLEYINLRCEPSPSAVKAEAIAMYLREIGSNSIATFLRGGEPVSYEEIVYDVGKTLKADVSSNNGAYENENSIIEKLFADQLDNMSLEEKKELFSSMGIDGGSFPAGATGAVITRFLLNQFGGFAIYKYSLIIANSVARYILRRGLSLATNAMIARGISVVTGPVGFAVTGLWLLVDLAGPAYRKTVPAVLYVAMLRRNLLYRIYLGVVGDGSVGKDSLIKSVFGIDTKNISPIAGTTSEMEVYPLNQGKTSFLLNYPGFNDYREKINQYRDDCLHYTDLFLLVIDLNRGVSNTDIVILTQVKKFNRPILICLNKIDIVKPKDKKQLIAAAKERLGHQNFIETAFDPLPIPSYENPVGAREVYKWVCEQIEIDGKDSSTIPKGF